MTSASSLSSRRPAAIGEIGETDGLCGRHGAAGASFAGRRREQQCRGGRGAGYLLVARWCSLAGRSLGTVALASSSSRPRGPSGRGPQLGGVRIYRRTTSDPDCDRRVIAMASSSRRARHRPSGGDLSLLLGTDLLLLLHQHTDSPSSWETRARRSRAVARSALPELLSDRRAAPAAAMRRSPCAQAARERACALGR